METFWKAALTIAGIGAIGSFVLWSLYKDAMRTAGDLSRKHRFQVLVLVIVLTFLFALAGLAVFVRTHPNYDAKPEDYPDTNSASKIERVEPRDETIKSTNPPPRIKQELNVIFTTDTPPYSGTEAKVFFIINGEKGTTQKQTYSMKGLDRGEKGQTDIVSVDVSPPLGKIQSILVGHDNSGKNAEWRLLKVEVADIGTGERVVFDGPIWLGKHDKKVPLSRELKPKK